ncbi:hypothetical protein CWI37_0126p0020 [Hamiltosporidium tvaerminnensis]|uniref:WD40 domain-containing protein n=1 Tax=Hamiltosporidium tvaerminnensis TaxID=1176355 RepID=A0A4Q9LBU9_9MICR|nr:hypothetical protein LUQ84_002076 [Hamiltosporidium tvaerminnensis]TBU04511.1 hypothetical protein CWI37_0126p0020 [Hamiltosporidium tvaerminnensis]
MPQEISDIFIYKESLLKSNILGSTIFKSYFVTLTNTSINFYSLIDFTKIITFPLIKNIENKNSFISSDNEILISSEDLNFIYKMIKIDLKYKLGNVFTQCSFTDRFFITAVDNTDIFFYDKFSDFKEELIYKSKNNSISSLKAIFEEIIIGTNDGKIIILNFKFDSNQNDNKLAITNNKMLKVDEEYVITGIEHIEYNYYCCVSSSGRAFFFDTKLCSILQTITVSKGPLRCLVTGNDFIYISGDYTGINAYSRVFDYYESTENSKIRKYRFFAKIDTHYLPITNLIYNNERIISVSQDGLINLHWLCEDKFLFRKYYFGKKICFSKKYFTVQNNKKINFYKVLLPNKVKNNKKTEFNLINLSNKNIRFDVKFKSKSNIIDYSYYKKYLVISQNDKSKLYKLKDKKFKKVKSFLPGYQVSFSENLLVINTFNGYIIVYCLKSKKEICRIILDEYEKVLYVENEYVVTKSKIYFINQELSENSKKIKNNENINYICDYSSLLDKEYEMDLFFNHKNYKIIIYHLKNYSYETKYYISIIKSTKIKNDEIFKLELKNIYKIDGGFYTENGVYFYNHSYLFYCRIYDDRIDECKRIYVGEILEGITIINNQVVGIKSSYTKIFEGIKEKYGMK